MNTEEVASDPFVSEREDRQEKKASYSPAASAFVTGQNVEQAKMDDFYFTGRPHMSSMIA